MAATPLTPEAVLNIAKKYWGTDGVSFSDASLLIAGVTNKVEFEANTGGWIAWAEIFTQIAWEESRLVPDAHNTVPPDNSYGLWQINMIGANGPDRRERYDLDSNEDLYNPDTNGKVAFGIFEQRDGFHRAPEIAAQDWSSSYRAAVRKIGAGTAVLQTGVVQESSTHEEGLYPGQLQLEGAVGGALDWASGLAKLLRFLVDPEFWKRVGLGALGIFVVVLAIVFYNRDTAMALATKGMVSKGKATPE